MVIFKARMLFEKFTDSHLNRRSSARICRHHYLRLQQAVAIIDAVAGFAGRALFQISRHLLRHYLVVKVIVHYSV